MLPFLSWHRRKIPLVYGPLAVGDAAGAGHQEVLRRLSGGQRLGSGGPIRSRRRWGSWTGAKRWVRDALGARGGRSPCASPVI